jgi:hypothetical protein
MTCHPERSGLVREAKQPAESKDPLPAGAKSGVSGSSHVAVEGGRKLPDASVVRVGATGSFDCVNASLREAFTPLRMTS